MKVTLQIFLILLCNQSFSQKQIETDTLELWTLFTTGNFINENAHRFTAQDWPFNYVSKAGDTFDDELNEEVTKHNEALWEILIQKGYEDPEKTYFEQYENERDRIELAQNQIIKDSRYKQLEERLKANHRMNYTRLAKTSDELYMFEIFSYDLNNLSKGQILELRLSVNIRTQKVRKK